MENASKALIMAGGVLLGILILSIGVLLYHRFGATAKGINDVWSATELKEYNNVYSVYIGRKDVSAQEIVSLIEVSQQRGKVTDIIVNNVSRINYGTREINTFLSNNILTTKIDASGNEIKENTFSFVNDSIKYDEHGRICEIKFKKN